MLRPYQMSSVIITGPKNLQELVIKQLYSLKVLHIAEHAKSELADIGAPLESANKLSEILVKVRALIFALDIKKYETSFEIKKDLLSIESATDKLNASLNKSLEELKNLEASISRNESLKQEFAILKDIKMPIESLLGYKSIANFTGYIKDETRLAELKEELLKITSNFAILNARAKNKVFIVLFIDAKSKEIASSLLNKLGFLPVSFPNIAGYNGLAADNLQKIDEEITILNKNKEEARKELNKLKEEYKGFLVAADEFLSEQLEKAEAPLKFAATSSSFLIKGWIPTEDLRKSIDRLNKVAKHKIFVYFEPAIKNGKVPVKLKNPKYARPFEFFMDIYTMPSYKEIDPTFFVAITFPLLFGFMLGDFGYGLTSLIIFWALKKKIPKANEFMNIPIFASLAAILFGLLFGEFFGYEEVFGSHLPHVLSRAEDINELMYLAVAVGIVHINLGFIIGFFNEFNSHGLKTAVYAKGGWIVLEAGVLFIALSALNIISLPVYAGIIVVLFSLFMLYKGEGVRGLVEFPSIFSNTLSYARLMAIGLSSVVLAVIVNESAAEFFHQGNFLILVGVLILIVGHAVNLMLGILGGSLHSLRLHYVEFFTKFFHGGAKKYSPFGVNSS